MRTGIFILFLLASTLTWSQGNLQFNQVKLVSTQELVPVGKVWKVESVIYAIPDDQSGAQSSAGASCGVANFRSTSIEVDGVTTKVGSGTTTASYSNLAYTHSYTILPLWLPAGASLSGGPCLNKVSVIEFNLIP